MVRKSAAQDQKVKQTLENHDKRLGTVEASIQDDAKTRAQLAEHATRITNAEKSLDDLRREVTGGFARVYDKLDVLSNEMHRQLTEVLGQLIRHIGDSAAKRT